MTTQNYSTELISALQRVKNYTYYCNGYKFNPIQLYMYMKKSSYKQVHASEYINGQLYTASINELRKFILSKYYLNHTIINTVHYDGRISKFEKCADCGNYFNLDDDNHIFSGDNYICGDCADHYMYCDHCDDYHYDDDFTTVFSLVNGRIYEDYYCSDCMNDIDTVTCSHTNNIWLKDDCVQCDGEWYNCDYANDYLYVCEACGEYMHPDDACFVGDYCYCRDCAPDEDDYINEYSYKPKPIFNGDDAYHFGMELECKYSDIENLHDAINTDIFYLKHDGSLSDSSCEIVSHPCTFDYWHKYIDFDFLNYCSGWHDGYGIHIHISRSAFFSQYHIEKVVNFFAQNSDFIQKIAQRQSDHWAKIQSKVKKSDCKSRYQAINQCNSNTIEFRIFQSTTKIERILKNIEFCDACIQFTKLPYLISELTEKRFVSFVSENKEKYPNLLEFINLEKKPFKN